MTSRILQAIMAVTLTFGVAATASAADLCLDSGGIVFVAKKFKVPRPGKCAPVYGQQQNTATVMSGVACTRSDGTAVRIQTTTSQNPLPTSIEWDHYNLSLPALTGTVLVMSLDYSNGNTFQAVLNASAGSFVPTAPTIQ
jgi:hypothetical protein